MLYLYKDYTCISNHLKYLSYIYAFILKKKTSIKGECSSIDVLEGCIHIKEFHKGCYKLQPKELLILD